MPAINIWDEEYRKEIDSLTNCVSKAAAGNDSAHLYSSCLHRMRGIKKSFDMEMKLLKSQAQKAEYELKSRRYDIRVNSLKAEYEEIMTARTKSTASAEPPAVIVSHHASSNDKVLSDTVKIQDQTVQSMQRTRAMVTSSSAVAYSTLSTLENQRQQIESIDRDLTKIDSYLVKSTKLVATYAKGLATDRICQGLTVLNILLLIVIIIIVFLKEYNN